jgi:uncharacterized membrane protein
MSILHTPETSDSHGSFSKRLRTRLVSGVLVLVPLGLTIFVFKLIFGSLSGILLPVLRPLLRGLPEFVLVLIAFCSMLLLVYLVGYLATHMIGRKLISTGERLLLRMPVIKSVYSASKQVVDSFTNTSNSAYKAVVMVDYPRDGTLALGFVTGSTQDTRGTVYITVFVPTTPNPTSGFMLFVPESDVRYVNLSVEEAVKTVFSGGMLGPAQLSFRAGPEPDPAGGPAA